MKPNTLINPALPTISGTSVMPGISPLVRVLAKVEKGTASPLRYGNRAQAEKKRESLANRLAQDGSSSVVIQVESRFLIAIFPAEYDFIFGRLVLKSSSSTIERASSAVRGFGQAASEAAKSMQEFDKSQASQVSHRPPFATVSGPRINPRNRHNQNGAGPVYCRQPLVISDSNKQIPGPGVHWPMNRREQYRKVSDRLNGRG